MLFCLQLSTFDYIDMAVCLLVAIVMIIFFIRRMNVRSGIIYLSAFIIISAGNVYNALTGNLTITAYVLRFVAIFLIAIFAVVNQSLFKSFNARINHPFRTIDNDSINTDEELSAAAHEIVRAVQNMAKNDTGALIIIAKGRVPDYILNSGVKLNAQLSASLLESIFNKKSPLHDGAVVIKENQIIASSCFLPLTQNTGVSKDLGTRHRAAIGLSEETNALSIVVSEETGIISTVEGGIITRYITPENLAIAIEKAFGIVSEKNLLGRRR